MSLIECIFLYKTWLLVHAAFFMVLLRISFRNADARLNRLEQAVSAKCKN